MIVAFRFSEQYMTKVTSILQFFGGTVRSCQRRHGATRRLVRLSSDKHEEITQIIDGRAHGSRPLSEVFLIERAKKLEQLKQRISALVITYKLNHVTLDRLQYFLEKGPFIDHDTGKPMFLAGGAAVYHEDASPSISNSSSGNDVDMDSETDVEPNPVKAHPEYTQNHSLEKTFSDLFEQPPINGRNYKPMVSSHDEDGSSYWFLGAADGSQWRSLFYMDQQCCTKAVAAKICRDLTNFLNSFPGFIDGHRSKGPRVHSASRST